MLVYPTYPMPEIPIKEETLHHIIKTNVGDGFAHQLKRRKSLRKKRVFTLYYSYLTREDNKVLYNFYNKVQETDMEFLFKFPTNVEWENEYIAKITQVLPRYEIQLPFTEYKDFTIYLNGVEFTDFEIQREDLTLDTYRLILIIDKPLNIGDLLTCDFNAKPLLWCEFDNTSIGVEYLQARYMNIPELRLIEVLK